MFPEYRELISRLKGNHPRFDALFEKHNRLDHEIRREEGENGMGYSLKVVRMKLDKLAVKREIQKILEQECEKS
ncbi:hypothetical protein DQT66_24505 [Salmonella enterica subsp. enterica]|nr:hypothetical protein [Salmonella enterica subsp. enterica]